MASQATAVSDIERAEHLNYAAGTGVKRVSIYNDGAQVNAATEETLQAVAGLNIPKFDYINGTETDTTTETYVFKTGGSGGTTVATVVVVFSDATKTFITSITKT